MEKIDTHYLLLLALYSGFLHDDGRADRMITAETLGMTNDSFVWMAMKLRTAGYIDGNMQFTPLGLEKCEKLLGVPQEMQDWEKRQTLFLYFARLAIEPN